MKMTAEQIRERIAMIEENLDDNNLFKEGVLKQLKRSLKDILEKETA